MITICCCVVVLRCVKIERGAGVIAQSSVNLLIGDCFFENKFTRFIDFCDNNLEMLCCVVLLRPDPDPGGKSKINTFVTRSREMGHLSKNSISIFLHHFLITSKCFIFMQTPLQLDIWLQSYEGFDNTKNNMKQSNLNTVFANISKTTSPTSDSFHVIMSHI